QITRTLMTCQMCDQNAIFPGGEDFCAQITFAAIRINLFGASYPNFGSAFVVSSVQFSNGCAHEDLKPNEGGNRIPRQADKRNVFIFAECQWFSRPHVDAPEIHLAVCFDYFFYKVKRTDTHTSRGEDHVHFE